MSKRIVLTLVLAAGLIAAMPPTPVGATIPMGANVYDKLTFLTFSGPVQVPGVTLDAGTYRFRLTNPATSRNVLQVLSNDGAIVYAMFHTMPASRVSVTDESTVTFRETPAGVPPAIRSIFWGGEHSGYEFVYPRGWPITRGELVPQPPVTYALMTEPREEFAEAGAVESEAAVAGEAFAGEAIEQAPAGAQAPAELPKTASPLPAVALGGITSLVLGLGAGLLRRRVS